MQNKNNNPKKPLNTAKNCEDCNENHSASFKEADNLLNNFAKNSEPASSDFKETLKARIIEERKKAKKPMKNANKPKEKFLFSSLFTAQRLTIGVVAVVIIAVLATTIQYIPGVGPTQPGAFSSFSSLIVNSAYAKDNFEVTAENADAIGIAPDSGFIVSSKDTIKEKDLRDNITITPAVEFNLEKIDENTFRIIPQNQMADRQVYRVQIATSYINTAGVRFARDYSWAFQVKDTFKVQETLPGDKTNSVPQDTSIEIKLSHSNFKNYEDKFSISPNIKGILEAHNRNLVFIPKEKLTPATLYTVTLKAGTELEGTNETIKQDTTFQFETKEQKTTEKIKPAFVPLEKNLQFGSNDKPSIPGWTYNKSEAASVNTTIYAYKDKNHFTENLKTTDSFQYWRIAARNQEKIDKTSLNKVLTAEIEITQEENNSYIILPETLKKGFYLAELESNGNTDYVYIQVSDIAVYAVPTETETIIWANSEITNNAIADATIKNLQNETLEKTTDQGIARIQTNKIFKEEENQQNSYTINEYISVETPDDAVVIRLNKYSPGPFDYYSNNKTTTTDYWQYIYTDRQMYKPTDTISVWGFLKARDNATTPKEITAKLYGINQYNYYGEKISLQEKQIKITDNSFETSLNLENQASGNYTLSFYNGEELILNKSVRVLEYIKPAYSITVTPEEQVVYAGEKTDFEVSTAFFDGTPLPEIDLKTKVSGVIGQPQEGTMTSDEKGENHISYKSAENNCKPTERRCNLITFASATVAPVSSEEAEIKGVAFTTVFQSKLLLNSIREVVSDTEVKIKTQVNHITLDGIKSGLTRNNQENYTGAPAENQKVQMAIEEITYTKVPTGEYYDPINKKVTQTYTYNKNKRFLKGQTKQTNKNGEVEFTIEPKQGKTYEIYTYTTDKDGNYSNSINHIYAPSKYRYNVNRTVYELLPRKEIKSSDTVLKIGESETFDFKKNGEIIPQTDKNSFLFYELQNGITNHTTTGKSNYTLTFKKEHIPNVYLKAVYFDGESYHKANDWFWSAGSTIVYDKSEEELNIDIKTDKEEYEPGEKVTLTVDVKNKANEPAKSTVNLNLIDEAFYAIAEESADPLKDLYKKLPSGIFQETITHKYRGLESETEALAEGGGCFLAGTQILMSNNSTKDIADIKVGDKILTRKTPLTNELVEANVTDKFKHTVSGYLQINGYLKVTPEHRVLLNGGWQMIGEAQIGDTLLNKDGVPIRIDSIEFFKAPTEVYNFTVEKYHTYIADGIYVHNDKGGVRESLQDIALFKSVETDKNGHAKLTFQLPDNITSWRITAQAITEDIQAGIAIAPIKVTKPLFVDMTMMKDYLTADKPTIKVRAFGTDLESKEKVTFDFNSDTLKLSENKISSTAFKSNFIDLPNLINEQGKNSITVGVTNGNKEDALKRSFQVLESRLSQGTQTFQTVKEGLIPTGSENGITKLVFADENQGKYYNQLRQLSWQNGNRIDQKLANTMSRELLEKYFNETNNYKTELEINKYTEKGAIKLFPYADTSLELTAKISNLAPEKLDKPATTSYLYSILESETANQEEVALALYGLAGMNEPILIPIQTMAAQKDLTVQTKLYIASAAESIGDAELARDLLLEVINSNAKEATGYTRILIKGNTTETLKATATAAVLAGALNSEYKDNLWNYIEDNRSSEILVNIEKLLLVSKSLPSYIPQEVSLNIIINGKTHNISLEKGSTKTLSLNNEQLNKIKFKNIVGNISLTTYYQIPVQDIKSEETLGLRKEYLVNGVPTNEFNTGDLIEVRLYPEFKQDHLETSYQLIDTLPSGLKSVSKTASYAYSLQNSIMIYNPTEIDNQKIIFNIHNSKKWLENSKRDYFNYYARVTNPGEYLAEEALLQSNKAPEQKAFSDSWTIKIK